MDEKYFKIKKGFKKKIFLVLSLSLILIFIYYLQSPLKLKTHENSIYLRNNNLSKPYSSSPEDISIWKNYSNYIIWDLYASTGASGSHYRILKDNIIDQDWQEWPSDGSVEYTVDTTKTGRYNYTIIFNDSNININSDSVWIYIVDPEKPVSNHPNDKVISQNQEVEITWQIKEIDPSTQVVRYRIFKNGTGITGESGTDYWVSITFSHSENIIFTENSGLMMGIYNYSIEFEDEDGHRGNDTIWIAIISYDINENFNWNPFDNLFFGISANLAFIIILLRILSIFMIPFKKSKSKKDSEKDAIENE